MLETSSTEKKQIFLRILGLQLQSCFVTCLHNMITPLQLDCFWTILLHFLCVFVCLFKCWNYTNHEHCIVNYLG